MASEQALTEALRFLEAAYPQAPLSTKSIQVYAELLQPLPDEILQAAIRAVAVERRWFPAVSDILKAARALSPATSSDPGQLVRLWYEECLASPAGTPINRQAFLEAAEWLEAMHRPAAGAYARELLRRIDLLEDPEAEGAHRQALWGSWIQAGWVEAAEGPKPP